MKIYNKLTFIKKKQRAITIGNFDGIHIGHKYILNTLYIEAKKRNLISSVMTFYPHPKDYFSKQNSNHFTICNLRDRIYGILEANIEEIIIKKFNKTFYKISALEFIEYLIYKLNLKLLVIGKDFNFGYKREGDIHLLKSLSKKYDFEIIILEDFINEHKERISSSLLRKALINGNIDRTKSLIGNNIYISGHVVHGNKIGRQIGFPTMNINVPQNIALKHGVYCVYIHNIYKFPIMGVANLGIRKTLGENGKVLLEIYLLKNTVNVYGKIIRVEFLYRLRNEEKFCNMEELTVAIQHDVNNALEYFKKIMDYKNTLNLIETPFPMKGDLPKREPIFIEKWEKDNIYNLISETNKNKPKFLLHDGPPYANGDIHLGHAVNKTLKDIILKHKRLLGFDACYIPGWDCHGMPIEIQIEKKYGKHLPTIELQKKAREYALEQIEKQKKEFKRLGVLGQWDNPYLTMNFQNESDEIKILSKILEYGYVKRGLKPVNWCFDCKSALAEAEIEYKDRLDDAIYVAFKFADNSSILKKFGINKTQNTFFGAIAIWTTTPWTIPANQALIINKNIEYSLLKINSDNDRDLLVIVAKELVDNFLKILSLNGKILSSIPGVELLGEKFLHPLYGTDSTYDRIATISHGDFVNIENGTGIVHSAPAFGIEDFECFKSNGFTDDEIINPVNESGFFVETLPFFGNMKIWEANEKIIQYLKTNNTLLFNEKCNHSYMHCWRHKSPLIFRATHQWFVNMDTIPKNSHKSLRENALNSLQDINFYPEWGKSRLYSMIFNRPDWTISRQRQWGVPIPFFIHKKTGQLHPNTINIIKSLCKKIEQYGISAWQNIDNQELLGNEFNEYEKSKDTLDVWFDSGSTNITVLGGKELAFSKNLTWPADLYLEGSDQHRGWFHSSLLIGCMLYKQAPYKALLTHGFVVDGNGKKMSKSIGNVISPKEITNKFGAEILRLWIAMTDYSGELHISDEILKRVVESYRRIRNTIRFLLANISDFDPTSDILQDDQLLEIDKYALLITKNLQSEIIEYYNKYEFHNVTSKLQNFCSEDLGSFYLDILKDRLYTTKANSKIRRSAQTALYNIALTLLKLMSPILSFTTEEAWQYLLNNNYKKSKTIFIETYHEIKISDDNNLLHKWNQIRILRKNVQNKLEKLRMTGAIGSSLQAEVEIYANSNDKILLDSISDELRFVFIVSKVVIKETDSDLKVIITPSNGVKCERCWNFCHHNDLHQEHKKICNRCFENIFGSGEIRYFS